MRITRRGIFWVVLGGLVGVAAVSALVIVAARVPWSSDVLRQRVINALSDRLDADVQLDDLTFRVFPELHVVGTGLQIRQRGRTDIPPLIAVNRFTVDATATGLWHKRIKRVDLKQLDIEIAPGDDRRAEPAPPDDDVPSSAGGYEHDIAIEELIADNARLTILPRERDKGGKTWVMHELHVQNVGVGQKMPFRSTLTNAVPPGEINTSGSFGPWNSQDPGVTPLDGIFTFAHANLGVFNGISGTLSAHGSYTGALRQINVNGETDTPDFTVKIGGHPLALHTTYHAIVDGTNGETRLEPVEASFLNTHLVAKGGVFSAKGVDGRLVRLDVTIDKGRIEDVMQLAVSTPQPPMTGSLQLKTKFDLPPGPQDVSQKLKLAGQFALRGGRFTDPGVQKKVNELSQKAQGKAGDEGTPQRVSSDFSGDFALGNGSLALRKLTFDVPGAVVRLDGRYSLNHETLAFSGDLVMDAKISQTTTGIKSLLLKMVDPLFRRNGRTVVPIKVTGTRNNPSFGLEMGRVFKR